MDNLTKSQRHKNMVAIKSRDTKIEVSLRKALRHRGVRYRKNMKLFNCHPDIVITKYKIAVFCDGDFWHGNPDKYQKEELRGHQIRAQRIDEYKTKWALMHSIPILRFWESDIRKNPKKVMKILKETLNIQNEKIRLDENKKKRH